MSVDSQIIAGRDTEPFDSLKANKNTYLPHALLDLTTGKLVSGQIPDLADLLGDGIVPITNLPLVIGEDLTGQIDGIATTFVTSNNFETGYVVLFRNGLAQRQGVNNDYVEIDSQTIGMNILLLVGETLVINYIKTGV
jgi:hypothetical protein